MGGCCRCLGGGGGGWGSVGLKVGRMFPSIDYNTKGEDLFIDMIYDYN